MVGIVCWACRVLGRSSRSLISVCLGGLRERGQDHDWLEALLDYLHDLQTRRSPALKEGLQQLGRGELGPA